MTDDAPPPRPRNKLTRDQAQEIRRRVAAGESREHLARVYGVHPKTITDVVKWLSWDDDVDEVAVERACKGDLTIRLTRAELEAAFHQLDQRGYSSRQIALLLGVSARSVVRWRGGHHAITVYRPAGGRARKAG